MNEPSDDELNPYVSRGALASHSSFPFLGANWNDSGNGQQGEFAGSPPATGRTWGAPGAPSPPGQKPIEQDVSRREDDAFANKRHVGARKWNFLAAISGGKIAHAERRPPFGLAWVRGLVSDRAIRGLRTGSHLSPRRSTWVPP